MSNVVSISCTCDYLVKRAARHRRSGRYDEAMALLWKARNQFVFSDALLMEMAEVYEAIGCDAQAARAYLRIVRLGGENQGKALFRLTIAAAQLGDTQRAVSYFDHLFDLQKREGFVHDVSPEMIEALGKQLKRESSPRSSLSARKRARALEKRAAALLQAGKAVAAQRAMEHSLHLRPTARGYTMLSCCQLIKAQYDDALVSAKKAHALSPGNVQALCVLADAYMAAGKQDEMKRAIHLAALRAYRVDDLLSVAVESAKAGDDTLTILLTGRILKAAPFHTRAMMIRACAMINMREFKTAKRILGRLCGLVPEDSVCESYYRALCAGQTAFDRLALGVDVTHEEGVSRASELLAVLCEDPKEIDEDHARRMRVCRLCDWVFHSPMAGGQTKTIALVLLSSLQSDDARTALLDLLTDPQISDSVKLSALQVLTARDGFAPYYVDMGGKLVRLAAGGVSSKPISAGAANAKIVQRVSDVLISRDCEAPKALLDAYLAYLDMYGHPEKKCEDACAAALECWYHGSKGATYDEHALAQRYGVSVRMMRMYLRRFEACLQRQEQPHGEE